MCFHLNRIELSPEVELRKKMHKSNVLALAERPVCIKSVHSEEGCFKRDHQNS